MCGRFGFDIPARVLAEAFGVSVAPEALRARWNVAPTQEVLAVRAGREAFSARWGLVPSWAKDVRIGARMINARAETLAAKPAYREALRARRCIVPASGFYEWGPGRQPHWLRLAGGAPMGFAGLWETWRGPDGGAPLVSCTIVTVAANGAVSRLHERMPAILRPVDYGDWLDAGAAAPGALLRPYAGEMEIWPVSARVNSPRNDGPELTRPVAVQGGLL